MKLSEYDGKYVRITDTDGNSFSGRARYEDAEYLECEWGLDEEGLFIEDVVICPSEIESIEEIVPHGTAELWTEQLVLRRCRPDDAGQLHECFGADPEMSRCSGGNPFATPEMTQETLRRIICSYDDERFYFWVMDADGDDVIAGMIGAREDARGQTEADYLIGRGWQGRGFAEEALKTVLEYLTENEEIGCVTARCAAEHTDRREAFERSGMQPAGTEQAGRDAADGKDDKLIFEYRRPQEAVKSRN